MDEKPLDPMPLPPQPPNPSDGGKRDDNVAPQSEATTRNNRENRADAIVSVLTAILNQLTLQTAFMERQAMSDGFSSNKERNAPDDATEDDTRRDGRINLTPRMSPSAGGSSVPSAKEYLEHASPPSSPQEAVRQRSQARTIARKRRLAERRGWATKSDLGKIQKIERDLRVPPPMRFDPPASRRTTAESPNDARRDAQHDAPMPQSNLLGPQKSGISAAPESKPAMADKDRSVPSAKTGVPEDFSPQRAEPPAKPIDRNESVVDSDPTQAPQPHAPPKQVRQQIEMPVQAAQYPPPQAHATMRDDSTRILTEIKTVLERHTGLLEQIRETRGAYV